MRGPTTAWRGSWRRAQTIITGTDSELSQNRQGKLGINGWKDVDYVDALAAAYAETRDFESAIKYEKKATELDPDNLELNRHLKLFQDGKPIEEPPNSR